MTAACVGCEKRDELIKHSGRIKRYTEALFTSYRRVDVRESVHHDIIMKITKQDASM